MKSRLWTAMVLLALLAPWCEAKKRWRTYENCTLIPNQSNDGDSFHVKCKRTHYIFRLYFVDACESDNSLPERVAEQAEYFEIDEKRAVALGKEAKKFTKKFLSKGFTVYSRLRDARGRSDKKRYYAMVQVEDEYLSEALVANGLARIHGHHEDLPDGTSSRLFFWRLKKAQKAAKKKKLGGWSQQLSRIEKIRQEASRNAALPPAPDTPMVEKASRPGVPVKPASPTVNDARPKIQAQTITLTRPLAVYSLKEPGRQVGILQVGAEVKVLGEESASMVRIRFKATTGVAYEAQCWRVELGL